MAAPVSLEGISVTDPVGSLLAPVQEMKEGVSSQVGQVKETADRLASTAAAPLSSCNDASSAAAGLLKSLNDIAADPLAIVPKGCVTSCVYPVAKVEAAVKAIAAEAAPLFEALTAAFASILDELRALLSDSNPG